ncbi:uncharacterized protein LOC122632306 isoform X1 [Vespula pensylvanica]|uniref:uncharacterized protein LOC122632306 isoform X1 n=1 Tax=Vespula pensylvanica TaxID=30213 RepID=UPI001CBA584A|nr:uncharacterized protein LOC122632306 isoform X1 [Vespula pensylvanica]XP_043674900.1 uncharacterized protein LOC122632306 isoform X1 [Vespula pensylvanica]
MANPCGEFRKDMQKRIAPAGPQPAVLPACSMTTIQTQSAPTTPMRPRSLYTTHSYHAQTEDANFQVCIFIPTSFTSLFSLLFCLLYRLLEAAFSCFLFHNRPRTNFQRYSEFSKYFETPPADQWTSMTGATTYSNSAAIWRQPRNPKTIATPYYATEEPCVYTENWREHETDAGTGGAITTPHGTISLRLRNRIRVDMTVDRAVRVINFKNNIVLSLSCSGTASALLHPNGRIYQYGSRVEILAHDTHGNNKYAKMWYKGVSFTCEQCALVYLVDTAGTRTTTDSFLDMSQDFSLNVFYSGSRHGSTCLQEAATVLGASQYWITDEGVENWIINNVRISQTPDGLVRIGRNSNKYQLRTSPSNGTASLTTPFLHCTASLGQTSHLFVRRGERRMHYDGTSFIVRNAGHSAGFDDNDQLKVY